MSEGMKDLTKLTQENAGGNGNENLPSTELREPISAWDQEEVHLRDYLNVMIRRKWLIIGFLGLTFISTLIFTLASQKIYKASTCIEVTPQDQKVTKFEEVVSTELRAREFYETQVEMLRNKALALRVIKKLRLGEHPVVIQTLYGSGEPGAVSRIKDFIASLVTKGKEKKYKIPSVAEEALKQQALLGFIDNNLVASPSRNSMLINISFTSPDRQLSQNVVNTFAEEFVHWRMEKKLEASQLARDFLMKQIERAKINLENAEEELNRFAKQAGIVSLDSKLNSVYRQLEELNSALAVAETDLIEKKAVYRQAQKDGPSHLPQVLSSDVVADLKTKYARLHSEYDELNVTFHDDYPAVKALKVRMTSIANRISNEEQKVFLAIENEYLAALKKAQAMQARVHEQKKLAINLNERATQYKIMAREVETNKGIYQSLLERTKEIESMVGVSSSNIHILDHALLPVLPFKPNVKMNLLLAVFIGLIGGIGCAFLLEYFADTITDPDEIPDRFQIPILGVTPFAKENGYPAERTFISDPRAGLSEALRTTKTSIQLSGVDSHAKSFLLTSTIKGEGKTTLAINLAHAFAGAGEKVVLIDADMRMPSAHKFLGLEGTVSDRGLSSVLAGVTDKSAICKTDIDNLLFIPAGPVPPNPVELLASNRFAKLMEYVGQHYDRIILDGPPYQGFADTLVLSQHVGGVVLVCSMGETTRDALRHFKMSILNVRGTILGCIINKVNLSRRYGYHSYYTYYHYYNYDYAQDDKQGRKQLDSTT